MLTRKGLIGALAVFVFSIVVAGTCFSLAATGQGQSVSDTDDWEYLIVTGGRVNLSTTGAGQTKQKIFQEAVTVERNLDQLGKEGWMLVAVSGGLNDPTFFMKRPVRAK